jgi:hypothetical protein
MNGSNALYKKLCGTGATTKTINVAVPPSNGNYASITGNPVAIGTNASFASDVYSVGVVPGNAPAFYSFSPNYAINRTWKIIPLRAEPYGTFLKFGFSNTDVNSSFSSSVPTDLFTYNGVSGKWANLSYLNNLIPIAGTLGTPLQINFNQMSAFNPPYLFTFKNTAAPQICN